MLKNLAKARFFIAKNKKVWYLNNRDLIFRRVKVKTLKYFVSAILGGMAIALGSAASLVLSSESKIASAFVFSFGFLAAAILELGIFTDKPSMLFQKGHIDRHLARVIVLLLGNIIGAVIIGAASITMFNSIAKDIIEPKLIASPVSILVGSVLCGILIHIGMHGYHKAGAGFTGCAVLILATSVISVCEFDCGLQNIFYIVCAFDRYKLYINNAAPAIFLTLGAALGNIIGALIFAAFYKIKNMEKQDRSHGRHRSHKSHHHSRSEDSQKQT